jgi:hypothetical protein
VADPVWLWVLWVLQLYKDLLSHLKQTDQEYPYPWGPYFYYSRTVVSSERHAGGGPVGVFALA